MLVIFENEDERGNSRRMGAMGPLICTRRVSRDMEGKRYGRIGNRGDGVRNGRGTFDSVEKRIWWRGEGISKGSRIEKVGARRKNDGGVHTRIQESSKR